MMDMTGAEEEEDMKNLETIQGILKQSVVVSDQVLQATLENIDGRLRRIEDKLKLPHSLSTTEEEEEEEGIG